MSIELSSRMLLKSGIPLDLAISKTLLNSTLVISIRDLSCGAHIAISLREAISSRHDSSSSLLRTILPLIESILLFSSLKNLENMFVFMPESSQLATASRSTLSSSLIPFITGLSSSILSLSELISLIVLSISSSAFLRHSASEQSDPIPSTLLLIDVMNGSIEKGISNDESSSTALIASFLASFTLVFNVSSSDLVFVSSDIILSASSTAFS